MQKFWRNEFFRTTLPIPGSKSGLGESISGLSVQAAVFKPRKCAGTKQEGNEGHFNQHRNVVQQSKVPKTVISETGDCNEIVINNVVNDSQRICDKKIKGNSSDLKKSLRISSLNIRRGLYRKEEELMLLMQEQNCDVCSFSEVDIVDFDEKKPFSINRIIITLCKIKLI